MSKHIHRDHLVMASTLNRLTSSFPCVFSLLSSSLNRLDAFSAIFLHLEMDSCNHTTIYCTSADCMPTLLHTSAQDVPVEFIYFYPLPLKCEPLSLVTSSSTVESVDVLLPMLLHCHFNTKHSYPNKEPEVHT